jgi:hypothetical protein
MHDLSLVVLGIHKMIPRTEQFELKKSPSLTTPETITANPNSIFAAWAYYIDWTVALYLVLICTIFCFCLALGLKYALSRRSYLYVEIGSQSHIIQLRVMRFPTAYRCYGFSTSRQSIQVALTNYGIVGKLTIRAKKWYMWSQLTGLKTDMPTTIWLSPWTTRRLAVILKAEYVVTFFMVHTHEYIVQNRTRLVAPHCYRPHGERIDGDTDVVESYVI